MKYIILLSFIFISICVHAQKTDGSISRVSKNKDTLWLLNSDVGNLIAESWKIQAHEPSPVIIFVDKFDDDRNYYYYRFSIENIESKTYVGEVSSQLVEIFRSQPIFYEEIKQFQVLSDTQIDQRVLADRLSIRVSYFKCSVQ